MSFPSSWWWLISLSLAALARSSVLADYLRILKDMKTQMDSVQNFLNAHISLLEELSNDRPRQKTDTLPGCVFKAHYLFHVLLSRTHHDLVVILIAFNPHNVLFQSVFNFYNTDRLFSRCKDFGPLWSRGLKPLVNQAESELSLFSP